jgi:hypothetical protein
MKKITLFFLMIMAFTAIKAQLPDNWTDDSGIDVFQEMTTVHGGTYSCGVIVNTDVQGDCDLANEVALTVSEGDDFKVSFWAYTSEQVRITCALDWVGAATTWTQAYIGPATVGWEQFVFDGIVPDGATEVTIRLRFYDVAGFTPPQTQYVDDVEFECPIGEPVVVSNGDFESWPSLAAEPTNYPTEFMATPIALNVKLDWTDATGEQLPDMYLIYASTSETIAPPADGSPVSDDLDLSDGMGAMNVAQGVQTFSFTALDAQTDYYFAIYPYTNSGTNINYKNDGTAPAAMAQTSSVLVLNQENFDFGWGDWTTVNVNGDQVWVRDLQYGIGGTPCAKVSGYESGDFANEDWMISPALNFTDNDNELLTFWSAMGYATGSPQLTVKLSTDYDGGGDPTTAAWTDLAPVLSTGDPFFGWTYSGEVDVSGFDGAAVYIAFVYFSDGTDSETWEIDDILITAEGNFTPSPEPTNYPTDFAAVASGQNINTSWVDATGETVPTAYLLKMSDQDNIVAPVDGTPEANDFDFGDGTGTINVMPGEEAFDFENLAEGTEYYFSIFPYTNSGSDINYKTDGTVPSAMATTGEISGETILYTTFNESWENWTPLNLVGDQIWDIDNTYGVEDTPCAKMSGYDSGAGASFENEDWLISPGIDLRSFHNEKLSFFNAYNYDGIALELRVSEDYDGVGNPNDFNWTNLTGEANWSVGEFEWAESGQVDISAYGDSILYLAFVFQSTTEGSSTWEVDNVKVIGDEGSGIEDVAQTYARVFPNPSNGTFNVQLIEAFDLLEVFSITGQMIYSNEVTGLNVSVNLGDAEQGMYFIRMTNQQSGFSISQRIIIQ